MNKNKLLIIICSVLVISFFNPLGVNAQCSSRQLTKVCKACRNGALNSSQCMATSNIDSDCPVCPVCPSLTPTPTPTPTSLSCVSDADCGGYICVNSKCVPSVIPTPQPTPTPKPTPKPQFPAVFYDDFSDGFPGNKWVYSPLSISDIPGLPQVDSSMGNPPPSLSIPFRVGYGSFAIRTVTNPFNSAKGLSISVDIRHPNIVMGSHDLYLNILNQNTGSIRGAGADVDIQPRSQTIVYDIGENSSVSTPYFPDTEFHNFKFVVDVYGNAKWFRDGILQASASRFPVADYFIKFYELGDWGSLYGPTTYDYDNAFNVDNVLVTSP